MHNKKVRLMSLSAVFAALSFVFTAYIHIPVHTGYAHIGDGFIYLAATMLPAPYAVFSAVCGAVLSDLLTGYAVWAPASAVIKLLTVLFFSHKAEKMLSLRNITALFPACILCVGGYYIYEALITMNFIAPLAGITGNIIQAVLSSVLFVSCAFMFDRMSFKKLFLNK